MAISRTDRGLWHQWRECSSARLIVDQQPMPRGAERSIFCVSFSQSPRDHEKTDSGAAHGLAPERAMVNGWHLPGSQQQGVAILAISL